MGIPRPALDTYFWLARTTPVGRAHLELQRQRNRIRYGVNSSWMFRVVELEINSMCNRRCSYCPNVDSKRPSGYMKEELFHKIVAELHDIDYDGRLSYHFYGEPLLDKRLPEFVAHSRRQLPRAELEIYSNGDFLTLEMFRKYLANGLDNFLITQHDNLIPENLQQILDQATADEKKRLVIRFAKDRNLINRSGLIENLGKPQKSLKMPCDWALSDMIITLTGNVVLCCNDYFESEVIGNVREKSMREVWASPKFEALREALSRGDRTASKLCVDCDYTPPPERIARIIPA